MTKSIAVIDGNSLMHRAFHAVPQYMTAPDGRPTNAVFGFISMLLKLVDVVNPDGIIVAFDHGIPAFRMEAIQQYKATRPPTDENLKAQFPMIKELLESMAIPVVEAEGWEGDDILGTLAEQAQAAQVTCLLVTGDKDALQLVDANTQVINTKSGMTDVVVYDSAAVYEKWGVTPEHVPDFLGLMGDSSDNIPGVPGVGEKKARQLLGEYGTLEEVLANAGAVKGKLGESLANNAELARASKLVATIRRDVPIQCDLESVSFPAYEAAPVTEAFRRFALTSQLRKVLSLIGAGSTSSVGTESPTSSDMATGGDSADSVQGNLPDVFTYLEGEDAWSALQAALAGGDSIAIQLEDAASQGTLFAVNAPLLYCATGRYVLALGSLDGLADTLRRILREAGRVLVFDLKAVLSHLLPPDNSRPAELGEGELDYKRCFDCRLAAYLLDSSRPVETIGELLEQFPQAEATVSAEAKELPPVAQPAGATAPATPPAAAQVASLLALAPLLQARLAEEGASACYEDIEMPLVEVLVRMERIGVRLDLEVLSTLNAALSADIDALREKAIEAAGEEFNLDSPKQLAAVLFESLRLPAFKKKRSGYSTDASVLEELKPLHPLPGLMLDYRELAKLKSTYLDALPRLVADDGHLHTSFNQTVTATGRLSSADPNLQNIPIRRDIGRQIRQAFVPDASGLGVAEAVFLSADYSQIELRLLAHLSGDAGLIEAFQEGQDFHARTASQVWQIAPEEVTTALRSRAKAVNFGIVYGQQAYGLSQSLGISMKESQDMIDRYFQTFPAVKAYLDETVAQAVRQGWVETIFGRRRNIRELYSSNANTRHFGERTAMNHPMQGSAADIIKLAMIEIDRRIRADGLRAQLILQVHDELVFNCTVDELEALSEMVRQVMQGVVELKVPLLVELASGPNWAEAK